MGQTDEDGTESAKLQYLGALRVSKNLEEACAASGVERQCVERWLASSPTFAQQVEGVRLFQEEEAKLGLQKLVGVIDERMLQMLAMPTEFSGPAMAVALSHLRRRGLLERQDRPRKGRGRPPKGPRTAPRAG